MMLEPENYLVIAMFATFIGLLFTGFPVAWVFRVRFVSTVDVRYLGHTFIYTVAPTTVTFCGRFIADVVNKRTHDVTLYTVERSGTFGRVASTSFSLSFCEKNSQKNKCYPVPCRQLLRRQTDVVFV